MVIPGSCAQIILGHLLYHHSQIIPRIIGQSLLISTCPHKTHPHSITHLTWLGGPSGSSCDLQVCRCHLALPAICMMKNCVKYTKYKKDFCPVRLPFYGLLRSEVHCHFLWQFFFFFFIGNCIDLESHHKLVLLKCSSFPITFTIVCV